MSDPRPDPDVLLGFDDEVLRRLRAGAELGFDAGFIARAEAIAPRQFDAVRLPLVHAWLRGRDEPAAVWGRLFAYGDAVDVAEARASLGAELFAALVAARALTVGEAGVRSALRLMPFAGMLLAADEVDARHDPVMGPGATTLELWRATAVPAGARVLDIGCGAGSLALACARAGAGEVVGVDLDARAVAYARFNARLNEVAGVRFAAGDLAAPVAGQRFDLIVSQPPFVARPPALSSTTYLHGGRRGDELALRMLGQLPGQLAEGGRALVLFDTADDDALMRRIAGAIGEAPVRVVAVTAAGHAADMQAIGYASAAHPRLGADYAAAAIAYRRHLAELGVERMRHVLLELEHVGADAPRLVVRVDPRAQVYSAAELAELGAALDAVVLTDDELLRLPIRVSPHARLVRESALAGDAGEQVRLCFAGGRASDSELSPAAAALVELLADSADLGEAVARYGELVEASPAEVASMVARFVRDSLVGGLLVVGSR